jgi:hypothetical protein
MIYSRERGLNPSFLTVKGDFMGYRMGLSVNLVAPDNGLFIEVIQQAIFNFRHEIISDKLHGAL